MGVGGMMSCPVALVELKMLYSEVEVTAVELDFVNYDIDMIEVYHRHHFRF